MQVLTKLTGYPYVGLLPAVRPIPPYICADFASPGYFMGGLRLGEGFSYVPESDALYHSSTKTATMRSANNAATCVPDHLLYRTSTSGADSVLVQYRGWSIQQHVVDEERFSESEFSARNRHPGGHDSILERSVNCSDRTAGTPQRPATKSVVLDV